MVSIYLDEKVAYVHKKIINNINLEIKMLKIEVKISKFYLIS